MRPSLVSAAVVLILSLACVPGLMGQERRQGDWARTFLKNDRDNDGRLSREEAGNARWFDRFDQNRDGYVSNVELLQIRQRMEEQPQPTEAFNVTRDVAYGEHAQQKVDVYGPKSKETDAPVMIYVHGGGWRIGDKTRVGQKADFFTGKGWILVSVNYRLIPGGEHPKNVEDVATAIAWVHENIAKAGGDPDAIFIMGHSAGCHLASLVATDEDPLEKAGKSLGVVKGVVALDTQAYDVPRLIKETRGTDLYTNAFTNDKATQRDASPMHHIEKEKGIPPFLICYSSGLTSFVNPMRGEQARDFAAALKKAGAQADVVDATDRNHSEINTRFGDAADKKVTGRAMRFLNGVLQAE